MKRRYFLHSLIGASLPLIAAGCSAAGPKTSDTKSGKSASGKPADSTSSQPESTSAADGSAPEVLRIGYQVIPNAELLAKALGLAQKALPKTKIEYSSFDSGRDVNTAFAAKGIDLGLAGSVPVAVGIAQGLAYEVYILHDIIGTAEALAVRSGLTGLRDIVGKKVGVPFGSTTHFSLLALLAQENIDPSSLTLLDLQPQDLVAAWQRGDLDAAYVWEPHLTKLTGNGGQVIVTSADMADRGALTADVGLVSKTFASQYPNTLKQYVAALDEAVAFYRQQPDAAAEALAAELGLSAQETLNASKGLVWLTSAEQADIKYLGKPGQPGYFAKVLKASADFMVGQKAIDQAPDVAVYEQHLHNDALKS